MTIENIVIFLLVGIITGWLAGLIWRGMGFGLVVNLIVGVLGSFIGWFLFKLAGIRFYGLAGYIIASIIGALILLFIVSRFRR